jgi:hypothetical protein
MASNQSSAGQLLLRATASDALQSDANEEEAVDDH